MNFASYMRRWAQGIRHAPLIENFNPLWKILRRPYLRMLQHFGRQGIQVSVGGYPIRIHPRFAPRSWESVEYKSYRTFASILHPGDIVYDVGAHIGTYTLVALFINKPNGKVVAFEPHPYTRELLSQHLTWNGGRERTIIRDLCCGPREETRDFYYLPNEAEGTDGLISIEGFAKTTVAVTTLDLEVARLGLVPNVIKIDVEGFEWEVLKGARETLCQYHPSILLSLHPLALQKLGTQPEDVLAWLVGLGYRYEILDHDHEIHALLSPQ